MFDEIRTKASTIIFRFKFSITFVVHAIGNVSFPTHNKTSRMMPRQPWRCPATGDLPNSGTSSVDIPPTRVRSRHVVILASVSLLLLFNVLLLLRNDDPSTESHHPLSTSYRRLRAPSLSQARYVSFGSSSTWGEGLDDPLVTSYPYLLSVSIHNAASRVGGSALSAACTQSIVGDSVYDVVTIEFTTLEESTRVLAQRMRQRFPSASIVFVRLWNPLQIVYQTDNGTVMDMDSWLQLNGNYTLHSKELYQGMLTTTKASQWSMQLPDDAALQETLREVHGLLYTLPHPDKMPEFALSFPMFQEDNWSLLSDKGHETVALGIQKLIPPVEDILTRPHRQATGSWGSGDQCDLWYLDGNSKHIQSHRRTQQVNFAYTAESHKHAIEVIGRGASITVNNPFNTERIVSLTYMTASDEEIDKPEYPRTRVVLNGTPLVAIEPFHEGALDLHLARTSAVGLIPPGETLLQLDPLQVSKHFFRLVGVSLLAKEVDNVPMDFAFEQEPAHESGFLGFAISR